MARSCPVASTAEVRSLPRILRLAVCFAVSLAPVAGIHSTAWLGKPPGKEKSSLVEASAGDFNFDDALTFEAPFDWGSGAQYSQSQILRLETNLIDNFAVRKLISAQLGWSEPIALAQKLGREDGKCEYTLTPIDASSAAILFNGREWRLCRERQRDRFSVVFPPGDFSDPDDPEDSFSKDAGFNADNFPAKRLALRLLGPSTSTATKGAGTGAGAGVAIAGRGSGGARGGEGAGDGASGEAADAGGGGVRGAGAPALIEALGEWRLAMLPRRWVKIRLLRISTSENTPGFAGGDLDGFGGKAGGFGGGRFFAQMRSTVADRPRASGPGYDEWTEFIPLRDPLSFERPTECSGLASSVGLPAASTLTELENHGWFVCGLYGGNGLSMRMSGSSKEFPLEPVDLIAKAWRWRELHQRLPGRWHGLLAHVREEHEEEGAASGAWLPLEVAKKRAREGAAQLLCARSRLVEATFCMEPTQTLMSMRLQNGDRSDWVSRALEPTDVAAAASATDASKDGFRGTWRGAGVIVDFFPVHVEFKLDAEDEEHVIAKFAGLGRKDGFLMQLHKEADSTAASSEGPSSRACWATERLASSRGDRPEKFEFCLPNVGEPHGIRMLMDRGDEGDEWEQRIHVDLLLRRDSSGVAVSESPLRRRPRMEVRRRAGARAVGSAEAAAAMA